MGGRMEWQPIETAPKDGTDILVFHPVSAEQFVVYFKLGYWYVSSNTRLSKAPSHWMSLPEPPNV